MVQGALQLHDCLQHRGLANIGIATYLFDNRTQWMLAALAGVLVGSVWNYAVTQLYTWGQGK